MIYSSSKDALRKSLNGIALEVQGTDYDEVSEASGPSSPSLLPFLLAHLALCKVVRRRKALTTVVLAFALQSSTASSASKARFCALPFNRRRMATAFRSIVSHLKLPLLQPP